jgi:hypothetical protein
MVLARLLQGANPVVKSTYVAGHRSVSHSDNVRCVYQGRHARLVASSPGIVELVDARVQGQATAMARGAYGRTTIAATFAITARFASGDGQSGSTW